MKPLNHLPGSSVELVEQLDARNKPKCIRLDETTEAAHRRAGRRELIDELIVLRNRKGI